MFSFSIYDLIWLLLNTKCLVICSYHTLKVMAILLQSDQQPKPWAWLHAQNSFGEKGHSGNLKQVTLHFNRNLSFKWCTGRRTTWQTGYWSPTIAKWNQLQGFFPGVRIWTHPDGAGNACAQKLLAGDWNGSDTIFWSLFIFRLNKLDDLFYFDIDE